MARKKSITLTDSEMRLMRIIWEAEPCTVNDVVDKLPDSEPLAYSTVLTTMRILEEKGYIDHTKKGRAFVYHSLADPTEVRQSALEHVMNKFFDNSRELLLANVLNKGTMTPRELKAIRSMLDASHLEDASGKETTNEGVSDD